MPSLRPPADDPEREERAAAAEQRDHGRGDGRAERDADVQSASRVANVRAITALGARRAGSL
jgi:hypothetical protein